MTKMPTFYISHGGGPWPWVPQLRAIFKNLEASFVQMEEDLPERPKAVVMISGHWEADQVRVMSSDAPTMEYDYSGFPPETYQIRYGAPGDPALAERIIGLLAGAGISATPDPTQGYDHGTFVPMQIMYPDADVPLIQVSMLSSYDPAKHFEIGRALAPLRDEGVLIIGSGLSYHNMSKMNPAAKVPSAGFDAWLGETLAKAPEARTADLLNWESAPYARECHVKEDHWVPIYVAVGAAEQATATRVYHETDLLGGITASSYRFD